MKTFAKAIGLAVFLLAAGCQVNVDNNLEASIDNQADALGSDLENVAADAGNTLENAGNVIENKAEALGNGIDVDVNVGGKDDAATNKQ